MTVEERERRSKIKKVFRRLDRIALLLDELGADQEVVKDLRGFREDLKDRYVDELIGR